MVELQKQRVFYAKLPILNQGQGSKQLFPLLSRHQKLVYLDELIHRVGNLIEVGVENLNELIFKLFLRLEVEQRGAFEYLILVI